MVAKNKFIEVAIEFLVGIIFIVISFTVGVQEAVVLQQQITVSQGNFSGIALYLLQLEPVLVILIPIAIGAGLIYLAYKHVK